MVLIFEFLQYLSKHSWPFFHRAIIESGSATCPWALETPETMRRRALLISEALGCNVTIRNPAPNWDHLLDCLKSRPVNELINKQWQAFDFLDFPFAPVVDGDFIADYPINLLQRGEIKMAPLLAGSNYDEANFFIVYRLEEILHSFEKFFFSNFSFKFFSQFTIFF